jgi:hypothetical protein
MLGHAVGFTVYVPAVEALYVVEVAPLIKKPFLYH